MGTDLIIGLSKIIDFKSHKCIVWCILWCILCLRPTTGSQFSEPFAFDLSKDYMIILSAVRQSHSNLRNSLNKLNVPNQKIAECWNYLKKLKKLNPDRLSRPKAWAQDLAEIKFFKFSVIVSTFRRFLIEYIGFIGTVAAFEHMKSRNRVTISINSMYPIKTFPKCWNYLKQLKNSILTDSQCPQHPRAQYLAEIEFFEFLWDSSSFSKVLDWVHWVHWDSCSIWACEGPLWNPHIVC
jgi:hypothetical protein